MNRNRVSMERKKMVVFYVLVMILFLFLVDHFLLHYFNRSKRKEKEEREDNKEKEVPNIDDPMQYMEMGYYYEVSNNYKKAIEYYEKAIEHGVKKQVVYCFLQRMYEEEKLYNKFLKLCEEILREDPYDLIVNESLAYFYQRRETQDIEKAYFYSKQVKKIEKINKMLIEALEEEKKGEKEKAISKYKEIIKFDPKYSQSYRRLGDLYRKWGNITLAIANYRKAVKFNHLDNYSKLWLGIILGLKGRKREATLLVKEVVSNEVNGNNLQVANFVLYYLEEGLKEKEETFKIIFERELKKVIDIWKEEIDKNPNDYKAFWKLGMVYFMEGMFEEMRRNFKKVIDINPSSKEAKFAFCLMKSASLLIN